MLLFDVFGKSLIKFETRLIVVRRQRPPGSDNKRKDRDDDDKPKGKDDDDEPKGPPRKVPGLFKKSKERGLGS